MKKTTKTATKASPAVKIVETREQKLARLAPKRVNIALNRIRLIGNLAAYRPTDAQVDKICQTLAESCVKLEARLRGSKRDAEAFTL